MNCDLLFALAEELNIPSSDRDELEDVLHHGDKALFLNAAIDSAYSFKSTPDDLNFEDCKVEYSSDTLVLPVSVLSDKVRIVATVTDGTATKTVDDWVIQSVNRNKSHNLDDFVATYKSLCLKKYVYGNNSEIVITVYPLGKEESSLVEPIEFKFKAESANVAGIIKTTKFMRIYE